MKNFLIILAASFMLTSCYDEVVNPEVPVTEVKDVLKINGLYGIKLENTFLFVFLKDFFLSPFFFEYTN